MSQTNFASLQHDLECRIERQLADHACDGGMYVFLGLLYIALAILLASDNVASCLPDAGRGT